MRRAPLFIALVILLLLPFAAKATEARLQIPIPGFQVSETLAKPDPDTGLITTDLLPEYIAAVYSYLVGLAGLLATAMIMYGGMKWIFAGGDSGKISKAKEVIQHALIGLVLALGSYLVLFTLNPKLTTFEALKIRSVEQQLLPPPIDEGDVIAEGTAPPPGVTRPTWGCGAWTDTGHCANPPPAIGTVAVSETVTIPVLPGISSSKSTRIHRNLVEPLGKLSAAAIAIGERDGKKYRVVITSGFRSYEKQVQIFCGLPPENSPSRCHGQYPTNPCERRSYCAVPGFSNHGLGVALDTYLEIDGKKQTYFGSKDQCTSNSAENIAKLSQIFFDADPGWVRYEKEIWHFEYNPADRNLRGRHTGFPAHCGS